MHEKQTITFRQYFAKKFEVMMIPILISLIILLVNPLAGLLLFVGVLFLILVSYFLIGKDLKIEKVKKDDDIYIYKWYYNRAKLIRAPQALFLIAFVILGLISKELPLAIVYLLGMALFGSIMLYLDPKIMTIEILAKKDVKNVFWLNRHTKEVQRSQIRNKFYFLNFIAIMSMFGSALALALAIDDIYRTLRLFLLFMICSSLVVEILFSLTYGIEDISKETFSKAKEYYKEQLPDIKDIIDNKDLLELK